MKSVILNVEKKHGEIFKNSFNNNLLTNLEKLVTIGEVKVPTNNK